MSEHLTKVQKRRATILQKYGPDHYKKIGAIGGAHGNDHALRGRLGGESTRDNHAVTDPFYYKRIGTKGINAALYHKSINPRDSIPCPRCEKSYFVADVTLPQAFFCCRALFWYNPYR